MKDSDIISLYWARDETAVAASDEKYGSLCRSIALNILNSIEDAEECTNDTWQRAWNTIPPQRPDSLRAYLAKIVRNLSLDRWRLSHAQKRGDGLEPLLDELNYCVPAAPSAEKLAEDHEITQCIERWLLSLNSFDRRLFLRRYWYGKRVDSLAAEMNVSPQKAAQRLYRLRQKLRRELEKEGIAL